jgi:exodeoxyribonuclease III
LKLATWNVNSVRARLERVQVWLQERQPDVLCLQELKVEEKLFPAGLFEEAGYTFAFNCQKTYNGVAIVSKTPITDVRCGLGDGEEDPQARLIAATVGGIRVITAYMPNGHAVDSDKYAYKLRWMERLRRYLDTHEKPDRPLLLCGDFNVAPEERDVYDPAGWAQEPLFHADARQGLEKIRAWGFVDTFRLHHQEAGLYSWWDYRMLAFPKGRGLRIDHVFATESLAKKCTGAWIDRDARKGKLPSDHAPVFAEFAS